MLQTSRDRPTLSPNNTYQRELEAIVSHAAVHLHVALGAVGTALMDRHGSFVFNHNALNYATRATLFRWINECIYPYSAGSIQCHHLENVIAFTAALDPQHVFIIVGKQIDDHLIQRFLASLSQMLPKVPTDA
jgi:hypothetical protein